MMMKKFLLAGACAGLLALGTAPALAAGPMMSGTKDHVVNGGAVQNVEYRWNQWQGRREWRESRPRYYAPRYGYSPYRAHSYAPWYGNGNSYWGHNHVPPGHWRHHHNHGYWRR